MTDNEALNELVTRLDDLTKRVQRLEDVTITRDELVASFRGATAKAMARAERSEAEPGDGPSRPTFEG